jgi:ABC-type phosphate transport system substrate-binding protein
MRALRTVALAGAAAVALSGIAIGAASADPPSGVVPAHADIVASGSDTIQSLFNAWSGHYNADNQPGGKLYSWDATGPSPIVPKADCAAVTRPNGSGAGIAALNANAHPTGDATDFCFDIARSSRVITTNDGNVTGVALAQDGIAYAANATTAVDDDLTLQNLHDIYTCDKTTWSNGDTIVPVLPQASSGTRQTFLTDIGITGVAPNVVGPCVINGDGSLSSIEENEGNNPIFTDGTVPDVNGNPSGVTVNPVDEVWPFSIGSFIAQTSRGSAPDVHGTAKLEDMTDIFNTVQSPFDPNSATVAINPNYPITRILFAGVRGSTVPGYLQNLLGNGDGTGWVCTAADAQQDVVDQGFLNIAGCGTLIKQ